MNAPLKVLRALSPECANTTEVHFCHRCSAKVRLPLSGDPHREVLCRRCQRAADASDWDEAEAYAPGPNEETPVYGQRAIGARWHDGEVITMSNGEHHAHES